MNKNRLFILLFLPLTICAQMNITAYEQASKEVTPDILRVQIHFEEEHQDPNVIKEHLNALVAEMKQFDTKNEFCHGGGYYVSPRYTYKDQKQIFMGYNGSLSLGCDFSAIEQYNALLAKLEKRKGPNVRMNIGALSWSISEKVHNATLFGLRSDVLHIAQAQAQKFSDETTLLCHVSAMTFEGAQPIRPVVMETLRVKTEEPLQHMERLSLGATVNYLCVPAHEK